MSFEKSLKIAEKTFETSCNTTPHFRSFSNAFRNDLKNVLNETGFDLIKYTRGHFYISAFIQNKTSGKMFYVSVQDVRFTFFTERTELLFRTAKNANDYIGGTNCYVRLKDLPGKLANLNVI